MIHDNSNEYDLVSFTLKDCLQSFAILMAALLVAGLFLLAMKG